MLGHTNFSHTANSIFSCHLMLLWREPSRHICRAGRCCCIVPTVKDRKSIIWQAAPVLVLWQTHHNKDRQTKWQSAFCSMMRECCSKRFSRYCNAVQPQKNTPPGFVFLCFWQIPIRSDFIMINVIKYANKCFRCQNNSIFGGLFCWYTPRKCLCKYRPISGPYASVRRRMQKRAGVKPTKLKYSRGQHFRILATVAVILAAQSDINWSHSPTVD